LRVLREHLEGAGSGQKTQKGFDLTERQVFALQDMRKHLMRYEGFSARQASQSNIVAAALDLYHEALLGRPPE
jgi:hypothetical protein